MGLRIRLIAGALTTTMALAACGGGSGGAASTTTAKAKDPTTTTTVPSSAATDAATLIASDMGGDWVDFPGEPVSTTGGEGTCADSDGTKASETVQAVTDGKILQRGELGRYLQTISWEFGKAAEAEAFATSRLSDDWIECVRSSTEAGLTKDPVQTVKTSGLTRDRNGELVGQYTLEFHQEIDGEQQYAGAYAAHFFYQKGTIVIDVFYQVSARDTDPKDLDDAILTELGDGLTKVFARMPA